MKKYPNILLALCVAATLVVGGTVGRHVRHLKDAEMFYRWILAEATQQRLFAATPETGEKGMMDRPLFDSIVNATESRLPDVPIRDEQEADKQKSYPRIVRVVSDESLDYLIWDLARSDVLSEQRTQFFAYLREKKLTSVASEFDPNTVYGEQGANVSLSNIFFGFRKVAANFVWLQIDRYWHQGASHRMLPLMKTCVTLDPTFVDAFLLGAWHLAYNQTAHMPDTPEPLKKYYPKYGARLGDKELNYYHAIDFLKDGIRKNPRDYRVYFDLGYGIYNIKLKDYANAVLYLSEAVRHRHDVWVPRMLNICLESNGQYAEALAGWQRIQQMNPENETARRFIPRNEGLLKEQQADEAFRKAKETEDPVQKQTYVEEGERLRGEALQIWQNMVNEYEEPFAVGRIMRMKALKLMEEERYVEAVAILENARWKSAPFWDEACDLMIEAKQKGGIALSLSEKKAVLRKQEAEKYKQAPVPEEGQPSSTQQ